MAFLRAAFSSAFALAALDSGDIDQALVAKLQNDAALAAIMPDGVYVDLAPPDAKRFVLVSLVTEHDVPQFGSRAFEEAQYLVKAVALSKFEPNMKGAAARIDALLEGQTLTATGYKPMLISRDERVRFTERDDVDPAIVWQHRGGRYDVIMST